jgi:hypothetical protein
MTQPDRAAPWTDCLESADCFVMGVLMARSLGASARERVADMCRRINRRGPQLALRRTRKVGSDVRIVPSLRSPAAL